MPIPDINDLLHNLRIVGHGIGPNRERFVKIRVQDGEKKRTVLLRTDNLGANWTDPIARLNRCGANLISAKARTALIQLIQDSKPSNEPFHVATRPGLSRGNFVLPD